MDNKGMAILAGEALSAKKAADVVVIDIAAQSSFADFFVNATAGNERQLSALADDVGEKLAKAGVLAKNVEGRPSSGWILLDYGDIIVNLFLAKQRDMYQLEKIWGDGEILLVE